MKKILTFLILVSSVLFAQTSKWTFQAEKSIEDAPAIAADGTIYACSRDGNLYALNNDGTTKWTYTGYDMAGLKSSLTTAPAIGADGSIYFASSLLGKFFAVNSDGTEKWSRDLTIGVIRISPAIAPDGTILVATSMGELQALNPADGTEKWNVNLGTSFYSSPAIDASGTIFIGVVSGGKTYLKSISSDGVEIWSLKIDSNEYAYSSPAIGADGTIYIGSSDYNLYAVNPDGTEKWKYFTDGHLWASPVIDNDGTIYIHSTENGFYAINPDGTEKWKFSQILGAYSNINLTAAVGDNNVVYIGGTNTSYQSTFYAINTSDGSVKWESNLDYSPTSPITIGNDGSIIFGADDYLYVYNSECTGLADSPWPKYRNGYRNTGFTTVATSVKQIGSEIPQEFVLAQNYPNPFNPSTTISFAIPTQANVKLSVYNSIGEEVAKLLNENISAGNHQISFDASNLSSGLYFYRISAGSFVDVKKMMLLK